MRWHDLLFLHWPVSPAVLRPLLPGGLELDTFDGAAWIGIVPFRMTAARPRYVPAFAGLAFPEIGVRTYVWTPGRSGVWFFSVDAANRIAVRASRLFFGRRCYDARIDVQSRQGTVTYRSRRVDEASPGAEFDASYRATGPVYRSAPATLDRWLTDRYCVYTVNRAGRLSYTEIHHAPWPLQPAEVELRHNTMTGPLAIELPNGPPLAHFAGYLEVIGWPLTRVETVTRHAVAAENDRNKEKER